MSINIGPRPRHLRWLLAKLPRCMEDVWNGIKSALRQFSLPFLIVWSVAWLILWMSLWSIILGGNNGH